MSRSKASAKRTRRTHTPSRQRAFPPSRESRAPELRRPWVVSLARPGAAGRRGRVSSTRRCLASFTQHNAVKLLCVVCSFWVFFGGVIMTWVSRGLLVRSPDDGRLGCLQFLTLINKVCVLPLVQELMFLWLLAGALEGIGEQCAWGPRHCRRAPRSVPSMPPPATREARTLRTTGAVRRTSAVLVCRRGPPAFPDEASSLNLRGGFSVSRVPRVSPSQQLTTGHTPVSPWPSVSLESGCRTCRRGPWAGDIPGRGWFPGSRP